MATLRLWSLGSALALGFALVLGGPAWLLREWLRPETWNPQAVEARFEWVQVDGDTLVFAYQVRNRSRRKAHLTPEIAKLQLLQPEGRPVLGYPAIRLPLDLAPLSWRRVEVRMELSNPWAAGQSPVPGPNGGQRVVSLPADIGAAPMEVVEETLHDLQGFELVEPEKGLRLVFPRGW